MDNNLIVDLAAVTVEMSTKEALLKNFLSAYYKGRSCDLAQRLSHACISTRGYSVGFVRSSELTLVILELISDSYLKW